MESCSQSTRIQSTKQYNNLVHYFSYPMSRRSRFHLKCIISTTVNYQPPLSFHATTSFAISPDIWSIRCNLLLLVCLSPVSIISDLGVVPLFLAVSSYSSTCSVQLLWTSFPSTSLSPIIKLCLAHTLYNRLPLNFIHKLPILVNSSEFLSPLPFRCRNS